MSCPKIIKEVIHFSSGQNSSGITIKPNVSNISDKDKDTIYIEM